MARPCKHTDDSHIKRGAPWTKDQCVICWWFYNNSNYRRLWTDLPSPSATNMYPLETRAKRACKYRGAKLRRETCKTCKGHVEVNVNACSQYGECTQVAKFPGIQDCNSCPKYSLETTALRIVGDIRHLIYHIYPLRNNDSWKWNLKQLRNRIRLFNGKRIIAIVLDHLTVSSDEVRSALEGCDCEFIEFQNDFSKSFLHRNDTIRVYSLVGIAAYLRFE